VNGILLIADEVQTGTAKMFVIEHDDAEPGIITMAKSLGGRASDDLGGDSANIIRPLMPLVITDEQFGKGLSIVDEGLSELREL